MGIRHIGLGYIIIGLIIIHRPICFVLASYLGYVALGVRIHRVTIDFLKVICSNIYITYCTLKTIKKTKKLDESNN